MIDMLKKIYHKLSGFGFVRWMGALYLNGGPILAYMSYRRLKRVCKRRISDESRAISVVFLCQNPQIWGKIESVCDKMLEDKRFEVHLVVMEDITEKNEGQSVLFFKEKYENIIMSETDGDIFDIRQLKPDYVFYQRPYDQYLPKQYRSGVVSQYAKVCYCPYANTLTELIFRHTMNKRFFRNVAIFFAENEYTKEINKNRMKFSSKRCIRKSVYAGYPIHDKFRQLTSFAENPKTVFLWTPRWTTDKDEEGSNFFEYRDSLVEYAGSSGMYLIFRPHPLLFYHFGETGEMSEQEIRDCKAVFNREPYLELDETPDYFETFKKSDVMLTDISSMVFEWFVTEKPIVMCMSNVIEHKFNCIAERVLEGCYVVDNWDELKGVLADLQRGEDRLKNKRKEIAEELFGKGTEESVESFLTVLVEDFEDRGGCVLNL